MLGGVTCTIPSDRTFAAFLFDMDGTILSSLAATERVWAAWARAHGLDVEKFLPTIHGRQAVETIRDLGLPGLDPEVEGAWILAREMEDVGGIEPIAGAPAFLASLPPERWVIVTSAPRELALRRLAAAGLPASRTMITADEVPNGKPAPDCYLLAARKLGVAIEDCLIFEDAPAGIASAEAAGGEVVVITAMHPHPVETAHFAVRDYVGLTVYLEAGRIGVRSKT